MPVRDDLVKTAAEAIADAVGAEHRSWIIEAVAALSNNDPANIEVITSWDSEGATRSHTTAVRVRESKRGV